MQIKTEKRLNYKKWREHLDEAMTKKWAYRVTELHNIRAHINGKIHRKRARIDWVEIAGLKKMSFEDANILAQNGGSAIFDLTKEDQAILLEKYSKAYRGLTVDEFVVEWTGLIPEEIDKKSLLQSVYNKLKCLIG